MRTAALYVAGEEGQERFWCTTCYQFRPHGHRCMTPEERERELRRLPDAPERPTRDAAIVARRAAGARLREIAVEFGLTTQRVSQIVAMHSRKED